MKKNLNIVLVHGAFGEGSHWRHIIPTLVSKGYTVRAIQLPLETLENDIKRTSDLIDNLNGPTLLVGHSYGGMVISGAGNNRHVVGLVYISAFGPDEGENAAALLQLRPAPAGAASIKPDPQGYFYVEYDNFREAFCQDIPEEEGLVMGIAQKPISGAAFTGAAGHPAWKEKPSWYHVSTNDRMIQPETEAWFAERMGAKNTIKTDSSHAAMVSHSHEVTDLILAAAEELVNEEVTV
ncbi:MAG: esterase/lipase/thioesterase protein [Mucilaginibacter sp.]|nr:esterase/lipase/thioesterase protein [Mucilaginibacter sp.]